MDTITFIACFSLILVGNIEDLDAVASLIVGTLQDVQVTLTEYPVGNAPRLQLACRNETTLAACYALIEDRIQAGMPVQIASPDPMPTRLYEAEPLCNDPACPCGMSAGSSIR